MASTIKPLFGTQTAITIATLNSLANGAVATSDAVNNSANLFDEVLLEAKIDGTAVATAWLEVRVLPSNDGGTTYATWESGLYAGTIDLSVDNQVAPFRVKAPQYFKVAIKNNTGAALNSANNSLSYQGINMQVV